MQKMQGLKHLKEQRNFLKVNEQDKLTQSNDSAERLNPQSMYRYNL